MYKTNICERKCCLKNDIATYFESVLMEFDHYVCKVEFQNDWKQLPKLVNRILFFIKQYATTDELYITYKKQGGWKENQKKLSERETYHWRGKEAQIVKFEPHHETIAHVNRQKNRQ